MNDKLRLDYESVEKGIQNTLHDTKVELLYVKKELTDYLDNKKLSEGKKVSKKLGKRVEKINEGLAKLKDIKGLIQDELVLNRNSKINKELVRNKDHGNYMDKVNLKLCGHLFSLFTIMIVYTVLVYGFKVENSFITWVTVTLQLIYSGIIIYYGYKGLSRMLKYTKSSMNHLKFKRNYQLTEDDLIEINDVYIELQCEEEIIAIETELNNLGKY